MLVASATGLAALPGGGLSRCRRVGRRTGWYGEIDDPVFPVRRCVAHGYVGHETRMRRWSIAVRFRQSPPPRPAVMLSEHLPMLAQQAHHLAVVNSVGGSVNTNDHHAGYYYNLTGHVPDATFLTLANNRTPMPDDWPFIGSVVASNRPRNGDLPNAITLPHKPSKAPYTRPGQFAARIGVEHDPLYLQGSLEQPLRFQAPSLELSAGTDLNRIDARRESAEIHRRRPVRI